MKKYLTIILLLWAGSLQAQYTWEQLREQALAAYKAGNLTDAAQTYEQLLKRAETEFGKLDERYSQTAFALAFVYLRLEKLSRAEQLYQEAKNIAEKKTGKESREYALMCNKLAVDVYYAQRQFAKAEPLLLEVKNIQEKLLGKEHPEYAMAAFNLGIAYYEQQKFSQAETLFLSAKNILEKVYGKKHPDRLLVCQYLLALYQKQNKSALAELLHKEIEGDMK
jgi:tetratricopeptide (TPR) repeat protein